MALWKSGLLPLLVLARRVNCDTQRISPSISFTLAFHILLGSTGSLNTRRFRLEVARFSWIYKWAATQVYVEVSERKDSRHLLIKKEASETLLSVKIYRERKRKVVEKQKSPVPMPTSTIRPRDIWEITWFSTSDRFELLFLLFKKADTCY